MNKQDILNILQLSGTEIRSYMSNLPDGELPPSDQAVHDILHLGMNLRRQLSSQQINGRVLEAHARRALNQLTNFLASELVDAGQGVISDQTAIFMAIEVIRNPTPNPELVTSIEEVSPVCRLGSQIARAAHASLSLAQGSHPPPSPNPC